MLRQHPPQHHGNRRPRARRRAASLASALERLLLLAWLVLILPVSGSDVARRPADISFASEALWAPVFPQYPSMSPTITLTPTGAQDRAVASETPLDDPGLSQPPGNEPVTSDRTAAAPGATPPGPSQNATAQAPALAPTAQLDATATATPTPVPRYTRGGIAFDAPGRLSLAYPVSFTGDEWVRFGNLEVLMADASGETYRRFITEYDRQLYAYPETVSNTFVLSVHDGTLPASGRELEAEPLRRLIEGSLNRPHDLETIERNLAALIGARIEFRRTDTVALFTIVQARRMSANDVAEYQYRPMELSLFMDPMVSPETSFLLLFCSGRQPDEPQRPFPGRYVFVLQESVTDGTSVKLPSGGSAQ